MNDYEINSELVAHYTREAERLRSIALSQWLIASWKKLKERVVTTGRHARSLARRQGNMSVPAPHH